MILADRGISVSIRRPSPIVSSEHRRPTCSRSGRHVLALSAGFKGHSRTLAHAAWPSTRNDESHKKQNQDAAWRTAGAHLDGKRREMWGRRRKPEEPSLQAVPPISCPSEPTRSHYVWPRQGGGHWFEPSIAHAANAPFLRGVWRIWRLLRHQ